MKPAAPSTEWYIAPPSITINVAGQTLKCSIAFEINELTGPPDGNTIRAIEYSAYELALAKIESLEREVAIAREFFDSLTLYESKVTRSFEERMDAERDSRK